MVFGAIGRKPQLQAARFHMTPEIVEASLAHDAARKRSM
jgi:hypothetical protein